MQLPISNRQVRSIGNSAVAVNHEAVRYNQYSDVFTPLQEGFRAQAAGGSAAPAESDYRGATTHEAISDPQKEFSR